MGFGPAGFEAYARLRFIPDPARPGQDEADVQLPEDHPRDLAQAQLVLSRLADFTSTPEECYFGIWEGYGIFDPDAVPARQWVVVPHRRYLLFTGQLSSIDGFTQEFGGAHTHGPPAFVWPADHRWCFASDVDPHWAGVGAEQAAIDALVGLGLDVVPALPGRAQPHY